MTTTIDIQMPVVDGIEATWRIAADPALAGVHVVIPTNYGLDEDVFNALRAGRRANRRLKASASTVNRTGCGFRWVPHRRRQRGHSSVQGVVAA